MRLPGSQIVPPRVRPCIEGIARTERVCGQGSAIMGCDEGARQCHSGRNHVSASPPRQAPSAVFQRSTGARISSIWKTDDYFQVSRWGIWWFRPEKWCGIVYRRDPTLFPLDVGISRHDEATPQCGGHGWARGASPLLPLQGLQRDRRNDALASQKVASIENRAKVANGMGLVGPRVSTADARQEQPPSSRLLNPRFLSPWRFTCKLPKPVQPEPKKLDF